MHKNTLQDGNPNKQACNSVKNIGAGPGTHAFKITSLFSHKAVEEAHKTVEDCRERLMQEQLFRRAKVERRLEKEEERERLGASAARHQQLSDMKAYESVLNSSQGQAK